MELVTTGKQPMYHGVRRPNPIYIGKDPNTVTYNGKLDDIRIYNRALSSEEVSALYRLESPNHFVEMNSTADLEMIWAEGPEHLQWVAHPLNRAEILMSIHTA